MEASRLARPRVILAAGWLAFLLYAYPGRMTAESFELLKQARTRFFEPSNPPALARMWRWLELVLTGPLALLLVQSVALLLGAYALLRRIVPEVHAAWAAAALLLVPPITAQVATISSTAWMTGLLVAGCAGLVATSRREHIAGLVALLLATAAQPRAIVATLPLLLLLFRWRPGSTGLARTVHAGVAWIVISLAALGATKHYTKQPTPIASYIEPATNVRWREVPRAEFPPEALKLGVPTHTTALHDRWTDAYAAIADVTPLFSPWLFVALAVLLVPVAMRVPLALALVVSGIGFQLVFRMSVWPIVAACLAAMIVVASRKART